MCPIIKLLKHRDNLVKNKFLYHQSVAKCCPFRYLLSRLPMSATNQVSSTQLPFLSSVDNVSLSSHKRQIF